MIRFGFAGSRILDGKRYQAPCFPFHIYTGPALSTRIEWPATGQSADD